MMNIRVRWQARDVRAQRLSLCRCLRRSAGEEEEEEGEDDHDENEGADKFTVCVDEVTA